jgi:Family of unknown function (DUF6499)
MNTDESGNAPSPNWRDPSTYAYTRDLTREAWAVEFLDRNPTYTALVRELQRFVSRIRRQSSTLCVIAAPLSAHALQPWGLHFRRSFRPPGDQ